MTKSRVSALDWGCRVVRRRVLALTTVEALVIEEEKEEGGALLCINYIVHTQISLNHRSCYS